MNVGSIAKPPVVGPGPSAPAPEASPPAPALAVGLGPSPLSAPPAPPLAPEGLAEAAKRKDPRVTRVFTTPTSRTSTTLRFALASGGEELKPGERWLFELPPGLRGATIRTVTLAHRKAEGHTSTVKDKWDSEGAYNEVQARLAGTDRWITWRDQYGSRKFAEPRSAHDPEFENLHDWLDVAGNGPADLIAVTAVGKGAHAIANVHLVEIELFPRGVIAARQEEIYTKGTVFADPEKGPKHSRYGGGAAAGFSEAALKEHGLYPGAKVLGAGGAKAELSERSYLLDGQLHVRLEPGRRLGGFEIAVGDTEFDPSRPAAEQRNKDGHVGKLGWAKLSARLENPSEKRRGADFLVRLNVPPQGVLSGGPNELAYDTKPGDEIVVRSEFHKSWVMGYRVIYLEPEAAPPIELPRKRRPTPI